MAGKLIHIIVHLIGGKISVAYAMDLLLSLITVCQMLNLS